MTVLNLTLKMKFKAYNYCFDPKSVNIKSDPNINNIENMLTIDLFLVYKNTVNIVKR